MLRRAAHNLTMSRPRPLRTLSASSAAALDKELMSSGAFSLDQLMELAGLSVSEAVHRMLPPSRGRRILVLAGPGNNGGDGLVAARHLHHYGYVPTVYYPKPTRPDDPTAIYPRLVQQLQQLRVPFATALPETGLTAADYDLVVDAVFGFSFSGDVREPFPAVIKALRDTALPTLAVDAPSSWDISSGPPRDEGHPGTGYMPTALISLTAPKPLVKWFKGGRHFVGGRFLGEQVAEKYNLDVPPYEGIDQICEVPVANGEEDTGRL